MSLKLPPKGQRINPPGNAWVQIITLPIQIVVYLILMILFLPFTLILQIVRASCRRLCSGKPSQILHKKLVPTRNPLGGYSYQIVFDKPLDFKKLKQTVLELSAEFGIEEKDVLIEDCSSETPNQEIIYGSISAKHHVPGKDWNMQGTSYPHVIGVRLYNASEPGKATIIHGKGCMKCWDGSSNFNFAKEYLTRYENPKKKSSVVKSGELEMNEESKEIYDNQISFMSFLCCQLPRATIINFHKWTWRIASFAICCGGNNIAMTGNTAIFNLDKKDSVHFYEGTKILKCKPYSALSWAAVDAHNQIMGRPMTRVCMQASLQTRCYEPKCPERNLVGDWLVGPLQRIDSNYDLNASQIEYESLLKQLNSPYPTSEVAQSLMGKAYGGTISGAAMFEPWATYPYDAGLMIDTLFFNNYGLRTMPDSLGVISWNWCAPFHLGCNCISVNGQTCVALASMWMPIETIEAIRDVFAENIQMIVAKGKGADLDTKKEM